MDNKQIEATKFGLDILRAVFEPIPGEVVNCNCPGFDNFKCSDLRVLGDCSNPNYVQERA